MHEILRNYINEITGSIISNEEFSYIEKGFTEKLMKIEQLDLLY